MSSFISAERASATDASGAEVGATVVRQVLPDPETAQLLAVDLSSATQPDAATCRALVRPLVAFLQQEAAAGRLVLP